MPEEFCEPCKKKKSDGKADKVACKLRRNCPNKGKVERQNATQESSNKGESSDDKSGDKRKPEESPPGKLKPQRVRDVDDGKTPDEAGSKPSKDSSELG